MSEDRAGGQMSDREYAKSFAAATLILLAVIVVMAARITHGCP